MLCIQAVCFLLLLYIVRTTCFDLCKSSITKKAGLLPGIVLLGIIIMTQPWGITLKSQLNISIPCKYLGSVKDFNDTSDKIYLMNNKSRI